LLCEGTDGHTNYSDLYVWDIERSECWQTICSGEKPQPRAYHSMIRVGKRAYVFSGSCWDEFTGLCLISLTIQKSFFSLSLF
jgi:hypothetical protein